MKLITIKILKNLQEGLDNVEYGIYFYFIEVL